MFSQSRSPQVTRSPNEESNQIKVLVHNFNDPTASCHFHSQVIRSQELAEQQHQENQEKSGKRMAQVIEVFLNRQKQGEQSIEPDETLEQVIHSKVIPSGHTLIKYQLYEPVYKYEQQQINKESWIPILYIITEQLQIPLVISPKKPECVIQGQPNQQNQSTTLNKSFSRPETNQISQEQNDTRGTVVLQKQRQFKSSNEKIINENAAKAASEFQVLEKCSLIIDSDGDFVHFKFFPPLEVKGNLTKQQSTPPKPDFLKEKYQWFEAGRVKFAEINQDGYSGFIIQWNNSNISYIQFKYL